MATYLITAYRENDFSIGTLLQTKFVEAGMSAAGAASGSFTIMKKLNIDTENFQKPAILR